MLRYGMISFCLLSCLALSAQRDSLARSTIDAAPVFARPDTTARKSDTIFMAPVLVETGQATWYGKVFEGRLTSSGERFCPDSMTAAHKNLPFGTLVKVTNLKNDSVVIVKITDRLPQNSPRCIDLTSGAAIRLNFLRLGVTNVKLEKVGKAPLYKSPKKTTVKPAQKTPAQGGAGNAPKKKSQ